MGSRIRPGKGRRLEDGRPRERAERVVGKPRLRLPVREDGQVLVEFALLAPLLLMIVVGIIQFGVALNYWLDMQRIANQGARWAVVNAYPGCPRDTPSGTTCSPTLQQYLASAPVSGGLHPDVEICFEEMSGTPSGATVGDPVTVRLKTRFDFVPLIRLGKIELTGAATMRVEQKPTRYSGGAC